MMVYLLLDLRKMGHLLTLQIILNVANIKICGPIIPLHVDFCLLKQFLLHTSAFFFPLVLDFDLSLALLNFFDAIAIKAR